MRTLISTLLLLILLSVAALAQETPPEPTAAPDQAAQEAVGDDPNAPVPGEVAPATEEGAAAEAPAETPAAEAAVPSGPVGEMHMADGTIIEILSLQKIGKFYLYISGKLDGRTSTVLSPTRLEDIKRWAGIAFQDQRTLTIVTKGEKELNFTDARLYLGSDDPTSYSFMGTDPNTYEESVITVKKADVKAISFK